MLNCTNAISVGSGVGNGTVTAGTAGGTVPLYLYSANTALTMNSAIVNNPAGGHVELVATIFNSGSVVLAGTNTYRGGTVVNGYETNTNNTLTIGASGTLPAGGLTINNATVTQTLGGLINPANSVTLNGASSLNLANTPGTLSAITFNNNGGTANPTVTLQNFLTLSSGSLAATTSNTTVATVTGGTLDFNGASAAINVAPVTVAGQSVDPWIASLNVASLIHNTSGTATALTVSGGGNLQLNNAQNTYTGGTMVNTAAGPTGIIIGGSSTPNGVGVPVVTGPLGTGTLTLGNSAVLISNGAYTVSNNVAVNGGFTFNGASNNLTLNGNVALASGTNTINVAAPQVTLTLGGVVSGTGASITKNGYGTLAMVGGTSLTGGDTYTGGLTLNSGVLLATGGQPFGTGPITINGGQLQLHNSTGGLYGNNLTINSSLAGAFIDVNSGVAQNATNGTLYQLGTLNESPATVLNVTGGNNGKLAFTGLSSSLTSASSPATFNVASGVTLILPGGFNDSNRPVIAGQGVLALGGNNTFSTGLTVSAGGTAGIAAQANALSAPYGAGNAVTLNNGSYLQISTLPGTLSSAGYTQGGLTGQFYYFPTTNPFLNSVPSSAMAPGAVVGGVPSSDSYIINHPVNIMSGNGTQPTYDVEAYSGLLNISASGAYSFGVNADDEGEIVIDGQPIHLRDNTTGGAGGFNGGFIVGSVNLTAGLHQITVRHQNGTGGSGVQVMYSGPDTLAAGTPGYGWQNIAPSNLYYSTSLTGSGGGNGYINAAQINNALSVAASAAATVDAGGSEFNSTFAGLSLAQAATLTVNNMEGGGYIGVMGNTSLAASTAVNPNTGMLYLIGGVTDSGNGLTKIGQGTLILGSSAATAGNGGLFTGPLNITTGYVQVASANALTSGTTTVGSVAAGTGATLDLNGTLGVTGTILLNGSGPATYDVANPTALYNSNPAQASLAASSLVLIGTAINSKNPSIGGYGDIAIYGTIADGPTAGLPWTKTGPDTLILAGSNTFTGTLTVSMGVLAIGSSNAFGSTAAGTVTVNGGIMDLAGQSILATSKTLSLTGGGLTGYAMNNTLGVLINSTTGTTPTYAGPITLAGAVNIGANTYNPAASAGNIVLSGPISGNQNISKVGADLLTLTGSNSSTGQLLAYGGTLTMSGSAGSQIGGNTWNGAYSGATFVLDNTPAAGGVLSNRMGGRGFVNTAGQLLIRSGSSGTVVFEMTTQGGNNWNVGGQGVGEGVFTLDATAGGSIVAGVNSTSNAVFNHQAQGTAALLRGTNLGQSAPGNNGSVSLIGSGTSLGASTNGNQVYGQTATSGPNMLVWPWAVADTSATGNGTALATYGSNGLRPLNFATDGVINALTTNDNVLVNSNTSTTAGARQVSLNSLSMSSSARPPRSRSTPAAR